MVGLTKAYMLVLARFRQVSKTVVLNLHSCEKSNFMASKAGLIGGNEVRLTSLDQVYESLYPTRRHFSIIVVRV